MAQVLDRYGRAMVSRIPNVPRRNASVRQAFGVSGTAIHQGRIREQETNPALIGRQRYLTFSDILANTSIVAASVRLIVNLISRAERKYNPVDDTPQAKQYAELAEELMCNGVDTPWRRITRRSSSFLWYGFSLQEWTFRRRADDQRFEVADVAPRPQRTIERWDVDLAGKVYGVMQCSPHNGAEMFIPRNRMVYLVDDTFNDSPEGFGILRNLVEPAKRLARFQELETWGLETDLGGVPIGRAPLTKLAADLEAGRITQDEHDAMLTVLEQFVTNPVRDPLKSLVLDSAPYFSEGENPAPSSAYQWGVELIESKIEGLEDVAKAIDRLNREMARITGTEQLMLGGDGAGSLALSKEKATQLFLIVDNALGEITDAHRTDVLEPLWAVNGLPEEFMPELAYETPSFLTVAEKIAALRDMATAGAPIMPTDPAVADLYAELGLSIPVDEDDGDGVLTGGTRNNEEPPDADTAREQG